MGKGGGAAEGQGRVSSQGAIGVWGRGVGLQRDRGESVAREPLECGEGGWGCRGIEKLVARPPHWCGEGGVALLFSVV